MAKSGSNTTWSSNGGHYVKVTWNETSQSIENNRSAVTVRLYVGSKSGWSISDSTNSWALLIDGTSYTGSNANISHGSGGEDLIATQVVYLTHNSDGTRSFSMKGSVSGLYFGRITGRTFSGTLDTIPRASTFAGASMTDVIAGTDKAVTIRRENSNFYHQIRIYLTRSGVSDYLLRTEAYNASTTSKTIQWTNSEISNFWRNGHGYYTGTKFILDTYSGGNVIGTYTQTGNLTYPSNNTIGSLSGNITLGSSVGVSLAKASSLYSHEAELRLPNGTVVASQGITSSSSFNMTPSNSLVEQNTTTVKSSNLELWIRTVLTADTSRQVFSFTKEDTVTITIPNSPPTMGTMSYIETDTTTAGVMTTSGVTNPVLVQNKSKPRFTFTAATAQRSASIVSYTVSLGGANLSRTTAGSVDFETLNIWSDTNAVLTVVDSRGFTNSLSIPVSYLYYGAPNLSGAAKRLNGFGDVIEITASAGISSLNGKNIVDTTTGFSYRYRELPNGTFNTYQDVASSTSGTKATMTKKTETLTNTKSYEFEIRVRDSFGPVTMKKVAGAGKPIMFMSSSLLSVGVNRFPTLSADFEVQDKMTMFPTIADSAKIASQFTGNTVKSNIDFMAHPSSTASGSIIHESSGVSGNIPRGVIHLCPASTDNNVDSYVSVHGKNQTERIKFYTGGNASFDGIVTVSSLTATSTVNTANINTTSTYLNISGADAEMVRFVYSSGSFGYISLYNGSSRLGYMGSVSNGSTTMKISAEQGWLDVNGSSGVNLYVSNSSRLRITGTTTTSNNNLQVNGAITTTGNIVVGGAISSGSSTMEGSLVHNSGYMFVKVFNTGSTHYSSASSSTSHGEIHYSGASNNRFVFGARTNANERTTAGIDAKDFFGNLVGTVNGSSKREEKENIQLYREDALAKINEAIIREYNYKKEETGRRRIGLIVDEVKAKEIVSLEEDGIDIYGMIAMSWKAIQQMGHELFVKDQEIESLHEKIEKQELQMEKMLKRIETIEGGK